VAVCAQDLQILDPVIKFVSVDVVQRQWSRFSVPLNNPALLAPRFFSTLIQ
jgi:hypothetical protein